MADPRATLVIILLLFIFFSPEQPVLRYHTQSEQDRLRVEKEQDFNALANSSLGDLPSPGLNLTGFRSEDGYQWDHLLTAQTLSRYQHEQSWKDAAQAPVYHDVNGEVKGDFVRNDVRWDTTRKLNLTMLDPTTEYLTNVYERNVTDAKGNLSINLAELKKISNFYPRELKAVLTVYTDSSPGSGWDFKLRGIHFPRGSIILTTSSKKFNALPALPHFTASQEEFERATSVMNTSITKIWDSIDQGQRGDDNSFIPAPKCELVVWLQQKPLIGSYYYIEEIEEELRNPEGAPIGQPPLMAFSAVVFSPDCGYILEADTVYGPKAEVFSALYRRLVAALCMIVMLQIWLLKRQMERCATPSTRSRVSYHTFGIAAFGDGLVLFALIGVLVIDVSAFLIVGAAGFLCCIHVAFLEVKFIFDIWTVQVGDPTNAQRERQRRAAATAATITTTTANNTTTTPSTNPSTEPNNPTLTTTSAPTTNPPPPPPPRTSSPGLPLPATAPNPNAPTTILLTSDQDTTLLTNTTLDDPPRASFASLYSRFYFALLNLMFFTLWATSWPPGPRQTYFTILSLSFFSLWLPQIHRNIMRNCRKALSWEYVLGTSVLRAVPVLYWYIDERNILSATSNPRTAAVLLGWLSLQILVLVSQQFLGPRMFVPERWCPPAYDYHPVLYDDLEAGGLPIGEITSASEGKDVEGGRDKDRDGAAYGHGHGSRKLFDCAICMNEIDVPVVSKDEKLGGDVGRSWLEQRKYMVTPCRHIFHSECLEGWMNLRLVCPVCREGLPPL